MKTALVVLDMLNDFVDGTLANKAAEEVIDPIASLVEGARARDDWVVGLANDAHQPSDLEFAVFGEHALAGTEGAAVVSELTAAEGDIVVPKRFYSAFTDTDLDATCRVHEIERMVIVGQHTNCCCRHTSYDAFFAASNSPLSPTGRVCTNHSPTVSTTGYNGSPSATSTRSTTPKWWKRQPSSRDLILPALSARRQDRHKRHFDTPLSS